MICQKKYVSRTSFTLLYGRTGDTNGYGHENCNKFNDIDSICQFEPQLKENKKYEANLFDPV